MSIGLVQKLPFHHSGQGTMYTLVYTAITAVIVHILGRSQGTGGDGSDSSFKFNEARFQEVPYLDEAQSSSRSALEGTWCVRCDATRQTINVPHLLELVQGPFARV